MTRALSSRLATLAATARSLSIDELDELLDHATELQRDGTFKRRAKFAAQQVVDRTFGNEEKTAEYEPTRALLNAVADAEVTP